MKKKILLCSSIACMMGGLLATSCVDNDYDLTDIDGTAQVQVKNLVLPINLDSISLKNIFDIEGESHIKEINGEIAA